jgi:hypothetical protein
MSPIHQGSGLELFLFASSIEFARRAADAGVTSLLIDWENQAKHERQTGHDTEINHHTVADLTALVKVVSAPVTVRINGLPAGATEIETALEHGAKVLMLPMAKSARDVEKFLERVAGRARTIVQIETQSLVDDCAALKTLPWDYAFIGLNDLMISRGGNWLWEPLHDGTLDEICGQLAGRRIGFGGITVIGGGQPLRFTDLLREYGRLGCSFSFLRRTFHKEIGDRDLRAELDAVQATWRAICQRGPAAVRQDHVDFRARFDPIRASARGRELLASK